MNLFIYFSVLFYTFLTNLAEHKASFQKHTSVIDPFGHFLKLLLTNWVRLNYINIDGYLTNSF